MPGVPARSSLPASLALLRPWLKKRNPKATIPSPPRLQNLLIIKPEKLGDMVVTLPMIDAVRAAAPEVKIDLLASPKGTAVVEHDPRFRRIELFQKNLARDLHVVRGFRRRPYDAVVEMIDDDSSTGLLLSQFCSARAPRIGANKSRFADYYDFCTDYHSHPHVHAIDRALELLPFLGIDRADCSGFAKPHLPPGSVSKAEGFLRQHAIEGQSCVAINVSAGKATRVWAEEKYASLIDGIPAILPGTQIFLISAPGDRTRGDRILSLSNHPAFHTPEGWSILDLTALLANMSFVISPDTSIVHLARSFRVPVVGLYPKPPWMVNRWKPYGQELGVVRSDDDGDIADITAEAVLAAFRDLVESQKVAGL